MESKLILKLHKCDIDLLFMALMVVKRNLEKMDAPVVKSRLKCMKKLPKDALKRIAVKSEHTKAIQAIRDNRYSPEQYQEYQEYLIARYLLGRSR